MKAERIPTANDGFLGTAIGVPNLLNMGFPRAGWAAAGLAKSHRTWKKLGDPGWIRTSDPQLRRLVLYPAELRGLAWRKVYPRRRPIERCALGNVHGPRPWR